MTLIKLDIDRRPVTGLVARATEWAHLCHLTVQGVGFERSRNGWHVTVVVWQRLTPAEIVASQAMLGSDWRREACNLLRVRSLSRVPAFWRKPGRWNVFFAGKIQQRGR